MELTQKPESVNDTHYQHFLSFTRKMTDKQHKFPCIPAVQGFHLNHFRFGFLKDPAQKETISMMAALLKEYSHQYRDIGQYTSLIVFFDEKENIEWSLPDYENAFWKMLTELSALDPIDWPEKIPLNAADPLWEFCFHGERYFVYSATPQHKNRQSRHFPCFLLAFTPRWAFDKFEAHAAAPFVKRKIRERLTEYDAIAPHPDLKAYGQPDNYEANQYFLPDNQSTRKSCPFHSYKQHRST
ncbi:hypothetical protein SAMN05216243_2629 [Sediminibacillus albus]|uniref:YqcI/YcgG family protein n=2 Tax=Sediminibacillus albus TaxID=407036 RepID=A0A1G9ANN4_9BACI|nr:hypothetical protein SAMN05216243_2629 [Sediminibacillus albus]